MASRGVNADTRHYRGMLASRSSVRYRLRDWNYYYKALTTFLREDPERPEATKLMLAITQMIHGRVEEEEAFRGALQVARETGQWDVLFNPLLQVKIYAPEGLIEEALSSCRSYHVKVKLGRLLRAQQRKARNVHSSCNDSDGSSSSSSSSTGDSVEGSGGSAATTTTNDTTTTSSSSASNDGEMVGDHPQDHSPDQHHHHLDMAVTAGGKY